MSLSILAYGLLLGGFLAGAAFLMDRTLRAMGAQTRWVWGLALAVTAGLPLLFLFWRPEPAASPIGSALPVDILAGVLAALPAETAEGPVDREALGTILTLLWIGGSVTLVAGMAWAGAKLRRAARTFERSTLAGDEVLLSRGLGPAVMGLLRPIIVLPRWTLTLDDSKLDLILLHEREHVTSRDPLTLVAGLLCLAMTPWNPWAWWLNRRLHLAVEGDCDRRVLAKGVPPQHYGDLLLEVAKGTRSPSLLMPALAEGGTSVLERRLRMIRHAVRSHRKSALVLGGLGSVAFLALACGTPVPTSTDDPSETSDDVDAGLVAAQDVPELSEAGEGYFLVRKVGEKVEYVGPVSPGEMEFTPEGSGEGAVRYYVRGAEAIPVPEKTPPSGSAAAQFRFQAEGAAESSRGTISIRTNDPEAPRPLIVVDGVIISDPGFMDTMDKSIIDRVEVIKGAAAEAQYGERGANGVVLIFTKG
jgi:TonB-dependent SusC/RagA subfamily outer membrane receptor